MGNYQPIPKALWDNASAGVGTTITGNGTSGATLISLHDVTDLVLSVTVGAPGGSSPTLLVQVDMQDAAGNWITQVVKTASITGAGTVVAYGGLHSSSPGIVLTRLARVAWTIGGSGGPSFPGVAICLAGR